MVTADMFADCQTKEKAPVDNLKQCVETGRLVNCDKQPSFRKLMETKHRAYHILSEWMIRNLNKDTVREAETFLGYPIAESVRQSLKGLGVRIQ